MISKLRTLIQKSCSNISKIYPTLAPQNQNHITQSSPGILIIQVTTLKSSLEWETRVTLNLLFNGITHSNVNIIRNCNNNDFHRLSSSPRASPPGLSGGGVRKVRRDCNNLSGIWIPPPIPTSSPGRFSKAREKRPGDEVAPIPLWLPVEWAVR